MIHSVLSACYSNSAAGSGGLSQLLGGLKKDHAKALEGAAAYVLAAWKGGELLLGLDKYGHRMPSSVDGASKYARTLQAAKLSESTAKRWQRIARALPLEAV